MAKTIKIKRSSEIFQSEREAVAFLARTPHQPGQPVLVRYWTSETEIDAILAVGTQTGIGPGTYTIVSIGGIKVISGIITSERDLPDASTLVNGEVWLYQEPVTHDLYWIYLYMNTREVTPVNPEINYQVFCLSDNYEYRLYGGALDKSNNYYSRDTVDQKINDVLLEISRTSEELSESISSGFQRVSETLGTTSGYTGTIPGATNFDDADRILQSRISQTSQTLQGLSNRVSDLEREFTSDSENLDSRLDQIWNWYDSMTHPPMTTTSWTKKDTRKLRRGTQHTYTVTFEWSWANRVGATGFMYKVGDSGWTEMTFDDIGISGTTEGNVWSMDVEVSLGTSPIVLSSKFNDPDSHGLAQTTVTPVAPKRTWSVSGLPSSWVALNLTKTEPLTLKVVGSYLSDAEIGNKIIGTGGDILKNIIEVNDSDVTVTDTVNINSSVVETMTMTWQTDQGQIVDSYSYTPQPGFFIISNETNAWDGSALGLTSFITNAIGGYQTWTKAAASTIPETEYMAGSTAAYISQFDIRNLGVKSLAEGSDTWTTISGFSQSGIVTYLGKTYYYRLNPNIGAGIFSFKFA
jgi:hypothetical protein